LPISGNVTSCVYMHMECERTANYERNIICKSASAKYYRQAEIFKLCYNGGWITNGKLCSSNTGTGTVRCVHSGINMATVRRTALPSENSSRCTVTSHRHFISRLMLANAQKDGHENQEVLLLPSLRKHWRKVGTRWPVGLMLVHEVKGDERRGKVPTGRRALQFISELGRCFDCRAKNKYSFKQRRAFVNVVDITWGRG